MANYSWPEKLPALLFCHPSMEDLAEAIAKRCTNSPGTIDVRGLEGSEKSETVFGSGDPPFLHKSISQPKLTSHQPVRFLKTIKWEKFKDGWPNLFIQDVDQIAGRDLIFLGNFQSPEIIFEQLSILYSIPRYLARSFKFILPYFPTGTMERIDTEGQIATAKTLAMLLSAIPSTARGPSQIVIFDIHQLQERFYFSDLVIPRLETALPLLLREMKRLPDEMKFNLSVAFPDDGAYKRFSKTFQGFPTITCTKIRDKDARIVNVKEGDPEGKHVIIVDDLVQTGGTLKECCKNDLAVLSFSSQQAVPDKSIVFKAKNTFLFEKETRALQLRGAASVSAYVTHAVFPLESWKSFTKAYKSETDPEFRYFWITDSIPHAHNICNHPPFQLLSLCDMISETLLGYDLLQL